MKRCLVALCALALGSPALEACAGKSDEYAPGSGKTLMIDKSIWSNYQEYLALVSGAHPGAFAVTVDGLGAAWSWCRDIRCRTTTGYANDALRDCERYYGVDCVLFARGDAIAVGYEILE